MVAVVAVALGAAQLTGVLRSSPLPEAAADTAATITIRPGGFASSFSPSSVSLEHGAGIKLVNKDTMTHSMTSVAVDKEGDPLFDVVVPAGTTGTLVVPATLAAGKYPFYCSFHPNMQGSLVVTGEGGDAPEPP